jgi:hypothetical protein
LRRILSENRLPLFGITHYPTPRSLKCPLKFSYRRHWLDHNPADLHLFNRPERPAIAANSNLRKASSIRQDIFALAQGRHGYRHPAKETEHTVNLGMADGVAFWGEHTHCSSRTRGLR